MDKFKGKKIAVIGEGMEGQSSAKFLKEKGADVTVLDQNQGKNYLDDLDNCDFAHSLYHCFYLGNVYIAYKQHCQEK